ncbi:MAG: BREX system ATP-binding domain-containing protein [Roseiflexaceae bacterium]|nr:BREX system ATP-binding domain-containing protein [Roseiflexaceae bacterium]
MGETQQIGRLVRHPQFGAGKLLKTYMSGYEWEVQFETGRRFRLPAREFTSESAGAYRSTAPASFVQRPIAPETDQFRARQTLETLRFGIVPVQDVETLTIGLEAERISLDRALARSRERGGDALAVIGDYGYGKSHFVELAARRALRENFLVASASLDLVEVPPSKANEIYKALTNSLRYPDTHEHGLRPLIKRALEHPNAVAQLAAQSPRADDSLVAALNALADCGAQDAYDDIVAWISGQLKPTAVMKTCLRKPPRLYLAGEVARQYSYLLTSISMLATFCGYSGMAILIDESEHYSLLRANQRDRTDAFFKSLIYAAIGPSGGRIDPKTIPSHASIDYEIAYASNPHLFFLFALTESENRMPVDSWLAPSQILRLDDRFIERDITEFYITLLRYHSIAYGYPFPPPDDRYRKIVGAVPAHLARALNQHRINLREVIRLAVVTCDLLFLHSDYPAETLLADLTNGLRVQ